VKNSEIVFYDVETTVPATDMIEFGAIVLDKTGLYEKETYSTLIHSSRVDQRSVECNGITGEMLKEAPVFEEVADEIYRILHGRIWAGHNIIRFDNVRVREAFKGIGGSPPEPAGIIDTLPLLRKNFGPRPGSLSLQSLGTYFGLGQERHRAIEDARMNIEVLKNCSLTLFLEEHTGFAGERGPATGRREDGRKDGRGDDG